MASALVFTVEFVTDAGNSHLQLNLSKCRNRSSYVEAWFTFPSEAKTTMTINTKKTFDCDEMTPSMVTGLKYVLQMIAEEPNWVMNEGGCLDWALQYLCVTPQMHEIYPLCVQNCKNETVLREATRMPAMLSVSMTRIPKLVHSILEKPSGWGADFLHTAAEGIHPITLEHDVMFMIANDTWNVPSVGVCVSALMNTLKKILSVAVQHSLDCDDMSLCVGGEFLAYALSCVIHDKRIDWWRLPITIFVPLDQCELPDSVPFFANRPNIKIKRVVINASFNAKTHFMAYSAIRDPRAGPFRIAMDDNILMLSVSTLHSICSCAIRTPPVCVNVIKGHMEKIPINVQVAGDKSLTHMVNRVATVAANDSKAPKVNKTKQRKWGTAAQPYPISITAVNVTQALELLVDITYTPIEHELIKKLITSPDAKVVAGVIEFLESIDPHYRQKLEYSPHKPCSLLVDAFATMSAKNKSTPCAYEKFALQTLAMWNTNRLDNITAEIENNRSIIEGCLSIAVDAIIVPPVMKKYCKGLRHWAKQMGFNVVGSGNQPSTSLWKQFDGQSIAHYVDVAIDVY